MGIRDFVFTLDDSVAVNEEEQEVVKVSKSTAIVRKKADDDIQNIDNVKPKEVPQTELKDETPTELVNSIDEEESSDESVQDPENDHISDMNVVINDDSDSEDKVVDLRKKNFFADDKKEEILYDSFTEMSLSRPLIKGLTDMGFMTPTKIQAMAIPVGLAGRDLCAAASTGSGKSGAFLVPIIERLNHGSRRTVPLTRVLIVLPTRELAMQCHSVATKMAKYVDITFALCVGGMNTSQQEAELVKRPDVVIATPGRLIDHVRNAKGFDLDSLEILVLDEADRMLDEGFHAELTEIIKLSPRQRQTLLFSATMTDNVDALIQLSLNRPVRLFIDSNQAVAPTLVQEFIRVRIPTSTVTSEDASNNVDENSSKPVKLHPNQEDPITSRQRESILLSLCSRHYRKHPNTRTIIFFPSKAITHRMKIIFNHFKIPCLELHGSLNQIERMNALASFASLPLYTDKSEVESPNDENQTKSNSKFYPFLLCTDLASRGLDIPGVDWVINYSMPSSYDRYIHRVGRTARYGRYGLSTSLCAEKDRKIVKSVVKNLREGVKLRQRVVCKTLVGKWSKQLCEIEDLITETFKDEKLEKSFAEADRNITKAQNMLKHSDVINSRPARTWFQTEKEKKQGKLMANAAFEQTSVESKPLSAFDRELNNELSKPLKRGKFDGLSRKTKRRKMAREQDEGFGKKQHRQIVSARRSKKLARTTETQ